MDEGAAHLESVGSVVEALTDLGLSPILVGGMALVVLGSRRVTRDFDFVVASPGDALDRLVDVFYDRGLELAARVDAAGDVAATIDNRRVAAARLRLDAPASAYFLNPGSGLRIDLLFDFPLPAALLARRAITVKARSRTLRVASEADLLRLKKLASAHRASPGDAEEDRFPRGAPRRSGGSYEAIDEVSLEMAPPASFAARGLPSAAGKRSAARHGNLMACEQRIDKAGRVVIPAAVRARAGLRPGTLLDVLVDDLSVRLVRRVPPPKLVRVGRRLVARPTAAAKDLPDVDVAALIEEERNRWPR